MVLSFTSLLLFLWQAAKDVFLKLIKSYLRSTTGESRLSALSILSIESDLVETLSFDNIISSLTLKLMKEEKIKMRIF